MPRSRKEEIGPEILAQDLAHGKADADLIISGALHSKMGSYKRAWQSEVFLQAYARKVNQ